MLLVFFYGIKDLTDYQLDPSAIEEGARNWYLLFIQWICINWFIFHRFVLPDFSYEVLFSCLHYIWILIWGRALFPQPAFPHLKHSLLVVHIMKTGTLNWKESMFKMEWEWGRGAHK